MKNKMGKTLYVASLGCEKNRIDTENVMHTLSKAGYSFVSKPVDAEYILVNTCAFIESAKKESIETILDLSESKAGTNKKLIVLGCLAQRYADELEKTLPEVDVFVGVNSYHDIVNIIENGESRVVKATQFTPYEKGRIATDLQNYAYIKIAEGCDNFCSYCAIPSIRGRYRSESMDFLLSEANQIKDRGIKELIIVAQDITRYGIDIYGRYALKELIKEMITLKFSKIRLMYAYPELIDDALLELIASEPTIAKYIDVPLQHVSNTILKRMNRRTDGERVKSTIARIKEIIPDVAIRSTFIVGFPGETDEEFGELKDFISSGAIDYAGFFAYSQEEGTPAASMSGMLTKSLRRKRASELSKIQSGVIVEKHSRYKGTTQTVLYEGIAYNKGMFYGRNEWNAPDVDTQVFFTSDIPLDIGEYYNVDIDKTAFHLFGKVREHVRS